MPVSALLRTATAATAVAATLALAGLAPLRYLHVRHRLHVAIASAHASAALARFRAATTPSDHHRLPTTRQWTRGGRPCYAKI